MINWISEKIARVLTILMTGKGPKKLDDSEGRES